MIILNYLINNKITIAMIHPKFDSLSSFWFNDPVVNCILTRHYFCLRNLRTFEITSKINPPPIFMGKVAYTGKTVRILILLQVLEEHTESLLWEHLQLPHLYAISPS